MKKILLPGMLATIAFAACTNEELVPQQTTVPEFDLSSRPVVGQVDLVFGPQTRMGLGDGYNGFQFKPGDQLGARLIDVVDGGKLAYKNHQFRYKADPNNYGYTNYPYTRNAEGSWGTEAVLVEGNYMFYAPYNAGNRERGVMELTFPIRQNINPTSEKVALAKGDKAANVDAVKEFFSGENGHTAFVGHYFLDATKTEQAISPAYNHLYAYPVITLTNDYTEVPTGASKAEGRDITIDSVIISSDKIYSNYTVNNAAVMEALRAEAVEYNDNGKEKDRQNLGTWRTKDGADAKSFLLSAGTEQMLTGVSGVEGVKNGNITVVFNPALEIKAGESFSFHVVMPAVEYATSNFKITPVDGVKEDEQYTWEVAANVAEKATKSAFVKDATTFTFAPGMWCPSEEYNVEVEDSKPAYKATAGQLTEYSIKGAKKEYNAPATDLTSAGQLAAWLEKNNFDHSIELEEGEETFTFAKKKVKINDVEEVYSVVPFDRDLMDVIKKYLVTGSIKFKSNMLIEGEDAEIVNLTGDYAVSGEKYIFDGGLDQKDGKIALSNATVADDSRFFGEANLTNVKINGAAVFNGKATLTDVTANGTTFNAAGSQVTYTSTYAAEDATTLGATEITRSTDIKGETKATSLLIKGENTTVNFESTKPCGAITVKESATLNMKKNYAGAITVGGLNADQDMTKGIVTIAGTQTGKVTLNMGDLTLDNNFDANNLTWNDDYTTTLTNNKTISNGLNVPAKGTYVHKGAVTGTVEVAADGIVENYKDIVVAENNGTIKAMSSTTHTTVNAGEGTIGNDYLAYVKANTEQTVYYTFDKDVKAADLAELDAKTYAINKVIFTQKADLSGFNGTTTANQYIKTYQFDDKSSLVLGANGNVSLRYVEAIEINGTVSFTGFAKDKSNFKFNVTANADLNINVNPNATLNVSYMTMRAETEYANLKFNLKSESGKATGKLNIVDSYVGLGKGIAPVGYTIDGTSTISNSYGESNTSVASAAINAGLSINNANVVVVDDMLIGSSFKIGGTNVTIDLNDHSIKSDGNSDVFEIPTGKSLTINGDDDDLVKADGTNVTAPNGVCAVWANGGDVTINGGWYQTTDDKGGDRNDLIYAKEGGDITINGGKFEYIGSNPEGHRYLLNCADKSSSVITVNGGTFKNHVPSYENTAPATYTEVKLGSGKKVYTIINKKEVEVTKDHAAFIAEKSITGDVWYTVK